MRFCAPNNYYSSHFGGPHCVPGTLLGTRRRLWFAPDTSEPQEGLPWEPRAGHTLSLAELPLWASSLSSGANRDLGGDREHVTRALTRQTQEQHNTHFYHLLKLSFKCLILTKTLWGTDWEITAQRGQLTCLWSYSELVVLLGFSSGHSNSKNVSFNHYDLFS